MASFIIIKWISIILFFIPIVLALFPTDLSDEGHWATTWAAAPQDPVAKYLPPLPFNTSTGTFANTTLRQAVHISLGGTKLRLKFSNAFSMSDLTVTAVTVGLSDELAIGGSSVQSDTVRSVTFGGLKEFTIPPNALAVSDAVDLAVESNSNLTVTMYLEDGQTGFLPTTHIASHVTSWLSLGNAVEAENFTDGSTTSLDHWWFLASVEIAAAVTASTFVVIGDSITDGTGSTLNGNDRWTDQLFVKMQNDALTANIAVANQGIGGNRVLHNGNGPNALNRFDRDVLGQCGIGYIMIYEGINDIRQTSSTAAAQQDIGDGLIWAYQQISTRAHVHGLPCFIATLAPNNGSSGWTDNKEATRQRVNSWIRNNGTFDAVIDFDAILRQPNNMVALAPEYSTSDHLHPNVAGYKAIADAFPLSVFS